MCRLQEVEGGKSVPLHPARSPPPTAAGVPMATAIEGSRGCFDESNGADVQGNKGSSADGNNGSSVDGNNGSSVDGCKETAVNGNKGSSSDIDSGTKAQSQNSSDSPHPAPAIIVGNVVPTAAVATDTAKQAKHAVKYKSGPGEQPSAKRQKVLSVESQAAMAAIAATARLSTQVEHSLGA